MASEQDKAVLDPTVLTALRALLAPVQAGADM